jgi:sigma-B regulation protein RsbU (phosphoserine phosphatase)
MLMAVWNDETRTLNLANAGSVQPMYVKNAVAAGVAADAKNMGAKKVRGAATPCGGVTVSTIQAEGFPLGLFPKAEYEEFSIEMKPGDMVVFFSDGIPDALNTKGEMFGTERLEAVLHEDRLAGCSAQATVDAILKAVAAFQAGTAHFDDETLVVLRVL